jgi:hypothetical protein
MRFCPATALLTSQADQALGRIAAPAIILVRDRVYGEDETWSSGLWGENDSWE